MSDVKKDSLQKYQGDLHQGPDRTAPYPVSRMAPATELVDMAREIAEADTMLAGVTGGKLKVLAEQMRALQARAHELLEETQRNQRLHRARCNFKKQPGKIYHLYRKPDGEEYFSMLSPEDWGGKPPHPHAGAYRLEADMSWSTPESDLEADNMQATIDRLLDQR
jgi:preprotein translocase subunit Sss1